MPYTIDWIPDRVIRVHTGKLTGEELIAAEVDVITSSKFSAIGYQIIDASEVMLSKVNDRSMDVLSALRSLAHDYNKSLRIAVVGIDKEIVGGFVPKAVRPRIRIYPTRIFPSLPEAMTWFKQ